MSALIDLVPNNKAFHNLGFVDYKVLYIYNKTFIKHLFVTDTKLSLSYILVCIKFTQFHVIDTTHFTYEETEVINLHSIDNLHCKHWSVFFNQYIMISDSKSSTLLFYSFACLYISIKLLSNLCFEYLQ